MADLTYYAAKIAECLRLLESSNDPLYRNVYQAMADEFAEKHAALERRAAGEASPPSPLLHQLAPPPQSPAQPLRLARKARKNPQPRLSVGAPATKAVAETTPSSAEPGVAVPPH